MKNFKRTYRTVVVCAVVGLCSACTTMLTLPVAAVQVAASAIGGATRAVVGAGSAAAHAAKPAAAPVSKAPAKSEQASAQPDGETQTASNTGPGYPASLGAYDDEREDQRAAPRPYSASQSSGYGGASQCAQGPGFSACQQADMAGMAMAVAGAVVVTSLFRDGEEVGSSCRAQCGDTEISISCPTPQKPFCQCGETPLAQCLTPEQDVDRELASMQESDATEEEKRSVLQQQSGR